MKKVHSLFNYWNKNRDNILMITNISLFLVSITAIVFALTTTNNIKSIVDADSTIIEQIVMDKIESNNNGVVVEQVQSSDCVLYYGNETFVKEELVEIITNFIPTKVQTEVFTLMYHNKVPEINTKFINSTNVYNFNCNKVYKVSSFNMKLNNSDFVNKHYLHLSSVIARARSPGV
ncbi:MAG TPA: hypothetical protein VK982_11135 [Bacteroidales bacterium]|nr:hypothetical protein [Bacteroidales bacterium]